MYTELWLKGTPYEKGFQLGSSAPEKVKLSLQSYQRLFRTKKVDWEAAKKLMNEKFLPLFTGRYSRYLEEIRGIANGADVDFEDLLLINLRTEFLYTGLKGLALLKNEAPEGEEEGECTAFSAVEPAASPGLVLAGQTWDFTKTQRDSLVICHYPEEEGRPAMLLFLEAGIVGGKGVNAAGLCLTLNALPTEAMGFGIPLHFRMRAILEQTYQAKAVEIASSMPMPCSANLIITHKDGISLSVEMDPTGCDIIHPEGGIIVHTNHFVGPKLGLSKPHRAYGGTYIRYQRMKQMLYGRKELNEEDLEVFFRDHKGWPTSVCVHTSPWLSADEQKVAGVTNYAFVAELTAGLVRFAFGNPCESEFITLEI